MTKKKFLKNSKKPTNVPLITSLLKTVTFLTTTILRVN